ncbi:MULTISPECIES: hypothetical protein [unclassified Ensifer]|uniref:hypothetical protein n=1 Tax=unclassified Ensifer TaxID=2633371 RepID=UPI000812F4BA|nr:MULTISPECIES: hypothetical protein [unclassified Ensifer]OCP23590.1 hypothetical protein BC363_24475 [Ensifer sp. LC384]OCP24277.1 hypothetical protein BC361_20955 [Ensifer sp. LC54]
MPSTFETLPTEILEKITGPLVDPNDLVGTLTSLNNLRGLNKSLNNYAKAALNSDTIGQINTILLRNTASLNEIPIGNLQGFTHNSLELQALTVRANFIPLRSVKDRSETKEKLLNYKFDAFPEHAMSNLISNLEYLMPEERSHVSTHVCSFHEHLLQKREYALSPMAERLVLQTIKKAEHLAPADRSKLVATSCGILLPEDRRELLEFWAEKAHLLSEDDQSQVLSHIYKDGAEKGRSLACFAEHLDKLSPRNRAELADQIIRLPADNQGKWQAISYLAEHLPSLALGDQGKVADYFIANYTSDTNENDTPEPAWYVRADFCKIEALLHLSAHRAHLSPPQWHEVNGHLRETTERTDPQRFEAQAQLITQLPEVQRRNFIATALEQGEEQHASFAYALSARIKDLTIEERQAYFSGIIAPEAEDDGLSAQQYFHDDFSIEVTEYNICNNLAYFTPDQRTRLVKRQLEFAAGDGNYENAAPAFADLAQNAKYLRSQDIESILEAADRTARQSIRDFGDMDGNARALLATCTGHAVRCLAKWAGEAISNLRAAQWANSVEEIGVAEHDGTDDASDRSDAEGHRASSMIDEWQSEEGSSYSGGSTQGSSDDDNGGGTHAAPRQQRLRSNRSVSTSLDDAWDQDIEVEFYDPPSTRMQHAENWMGTSASAAISISSDDETDQQSLTNAGGGRREHGRSRSVSTSVVDGSSARTNHEVQYLDNPTSRRFGNRLGMSASEAIAIASDDEGAASIFPAGPSNPAGRVDKRRREETPVDQRYDTSSNEGPQPKRQQLDNRERSRSSTIEL